MGLPLSAEEKSNDQINFYRLGAKNLEPDRRLHKSEWLRQLLRPEIRSAFPWTSLVILSNKGLNSTIVFGSRCRDWGTWRQEHLNERAVR